MESGTDEDDSDGDMEEDPFVSPPPSEDDIERQIRDEFDNGNNGPVRAQTSKIRIVTSSMYSFCL